MCSVSGKLFICTLVTVVRVVQCEFKLTILHTNDMHSRFQETNTFSGPCMKPPCYGGFARLKTAVDHFREEAMNKDRSSIFLNAGDSYQGSIFYTMFKNKIVSEMVNMLGLDALSLGNHEFDDGPENLVPFVQNSTTPIVCCNIDYSKEPKMTNKSSSLEKLVPSTVLNVDGHKIGVIGYLTPETKFLATVGDVELLDEVTEIKKQAKRLKAEGVNILIAVGHSGFGVDQKIAKEVPDLDIVVGGHTNTFLYNGAKPSIENIEGPYPTVVKQASGRKVLVVTAYAYTKYLGHLDVTINDEGEVTHYEGNPILLDESFVKDEEIDEVVQKYEAIIKEKVSTKKVGTTKVFLEAGVNCRINECNFGNLVTDAFIYASTKDFYGKKKWTNTPVAFVNGGSLRSSIANDQNPGGEITTMDLMTALPFENTVEQLVMKGSVLLSVLEKSVEKFSMQDRPGGFLQYSGIQVVYDLSKPPMKRVFSAKVRCSDCLIPKYEALVETQNYTVLTSNYLAQGGDGYTMLKQIKDRKVLFTDRTALEDYLEQVGVVYPEVDGRIQCVGEILKPNGASNNINVCAGVMILCTVFLNFTTKHLLGS